MHNILASVSRVFRAIAVCAPTLLIVAHAAPSSMAAEPRPKSERRATEDATKMPASSPLDDALLKDLDNELLEGAGDLKGGDKPRPAAPAPEKPPANRKADGGEAEGEDIGAPGHDEDPLMRISEAMRSAENLIPKQVKRATAEQVQRRIVQDLAALIEQAEKQHAQQASSSKQSKSQKTAKRQMVQQPKSGRSGKDSNKPAKDSTDRLSKADATEPDPQLRRDLLKDVWGHLPAHAREQMLQNAPEQFLPQYELMIERYYKRLAEEQGSK
jgi:hypothetical protein